MHLVRDAVGFASDSDGSEGLKAASVWRDLKAASLPFLRCAALFYHHLTNVSGPPDLVHFSEGKTSIRELLDKNGGDQKCVPYCSMNFIIIFR